MNDSIFEGTFLGNDDTAGTPADNDAEEIIDMPEIDDASSEDETSSGNILELLSRMREMMSDSDDEDDADESDMDSDDYHNKAVDRARRGKKREAAGICMEGLKKFPRNVDLLADTIKYSSEAGDMRTAAAHYSILKESVPFRAGIGVHSRSRSTIFSKKTRSRTRTNADTSLPITRSTSPMRKRQAWPRASWKRRLATPKAA